MDFSFEQAKEYLDKTTGQAQEMLRNTEQMDALLVSFENKLKEIPNVGSLLADVPLMVSMIKSYLAKTYEKVSPKVVATMVGSLIYLVKKKDIIPDNLPIVGHADDIAVIAAALKICEPELKEFAAWRDGANQA